MGETADYDYGPEHVCEAFAAYDKLKHASWVDLVLLCFDEKNWVVRICPFGFPKFVLFQVGLSLVHDHSGRCFKRAATPKVTLRRDVEARRCEVSKHVSMYFRNISMSSRSYTLRGSIAGCPRSKSGALAWAWQLPDWPFGLIFSVGLIY